MAKTNLKDLGSSVCVDDQNEKYIPALGNGSSIPGDAVYIDPANGRVVGSDIGGAEWFHGLLMESKITGTEAAPATDIPCKIVVPKSAHNYRVRMLDQNAGKNTGASVIISGTAGKFDATANIVDGVATFSLEYIDDDTVAEVTWK